MKTIPIVLLLGLLLHRQSDEEKALEVFKDFVRHSRNEDFQKASECIHPKSLAKIKKSILVGLSIGEAADQEKRARTLGYDDLKQVEKADPTEVYVRYQRRWQDGLPHRWLLGRYVEEIIGTISKNERVYFVAMTKSSFGGGAIREEPVLFVAYKDGDKWKLADQGEADIGK